jgi:putative ABC transport system permease protein
MSLRTLLDHLGHDTRYAIRGMRRRPAFTAMVAGTLALGIGATVTMFGALDKLLLQPPALVADPDRVVMLHVKAVGRDGVQTSQSYAFHKMMGEQVTDFEDVSTFTPSSVVRRSYYPVGRGVTATRAAGVMVSANFFSLLGVHPALGRFFTQQEEPESGGQKLAVLGYGYWQTAYGGSAQAIGRTIELGTERYTIIGVTPRGFSGVELRDVDVWLPIAGAPGLRFAKGADWATSTNSQWLLALARLKPGASPEHAAAQATVAYRNWSRATLAKPTPALLAYVDSQSVLLGSIIPGRSLWTWQFSGSGSDMKVAKLVGAVALIVLLIACANVANLLLVRALGRRREIAVRLALGVGRRRLIGQLVIEGLLLAALGAAGALGVAIVSSQIVRRWLIGDGAWTGGIVNGRLLAFTIAVGVVSGLVTSLAPAFEASRLDLTPALKAGAREGSVQRSWTRAGLLGAQVALAIVLLTGAGVFLKSLRNVGALDMGIDMSHVLMASISQGSAGLTNEQSLRLFEQFSERVRQIPGVRTSAVSIGLPFSLSWGTRVSLPGREAPKKRNGPFQYAVTPGYFDALGIRLLAGRTFTDADRAGTAPVVIVNATLAKQLWPGQSPIGSCLKVGADSLPCSTVIGVVSDTRRQDLVEEPVTQVYLSLEQLPFSRTESTVSFFGYTLVARTTGDAQSYTETIRRTMQGVSSVVPYANVQTMRDLIGRHTRSWELGANVFSAFGALALVLASIGLFSVVAFTLGQRMHEFGVRRALGAQTIDLLTLGVTRGLGPVVAGIVAGVVITIGAERFVDSLLFQETAHDPVVLLSATVSLFGAAVVASLVPARRAAGVDPTVALRSE